jgi:sec-independent protein translocase protein TatA
MAFQTMAFTVSNTMPTHLAIFGLPGGVEYLIIAGIALLFFGNRIPGVARSLGQGIVEFRKGLKGGGDEQKKIAEGQAEEKQED